MKRNGMQLLRELQQHRERELKRKERKERERKAALIELRDDVVGILHEVAEFLNEGSRRGDQTVRVIFGNASYGGLATFRCDCICHCDSIVQGIHMPEKGTNESLCMTCLERHNRGDVEHQPWPTSRVIVLPPERKS